MRSVRLGWARPPKCDALTSLHNLIAYTRQTNWPVRFGAGFEDGGCDVGIYQ